MIKGKDHIGVGVGALIFKDKKILIGKRGSKARDDVGLWEFPGGGVDFGETFEGAIRREVMEEFGVQIGNLKFLRVIEQIQDGKHWVGISYTADWVSGEARPLEEDKFSEFKWATIKEIEKLDLTIPCAQNLEALKLNLSQ